MRQAAGLAAAGGRLPATGKRNISSLLTGSAGGTVWVARVGPVVTLSFEDMTFSGENSGYGQVLTLAPGFRPLITLRDNFYSPHEPEQIVVFTNGVINMHRQAGERLRRVFTFVSEEAWPADLPGTAS